MLFLALTGLVLAYKSVFLAIFTATRKFRGLIFRALNFVEDLFVLHVQCFISSSEPSNKLILILNILILVLNTKKTKYYLFIVNLKYVNLLL